MGKASILQHTVQLLLTHKDLIVFYEGIRFSLVYYSIHPIPLKWISLNPTIIRLMRLSWPFYSSTCSCFCSALFFSLLLICMLFSLQVSWGSKVDVAYSAGLGTQLLWPKLLNKLWVLPYAWQYKAYGSFLHWLLLVWSIILLSKRRLMPRHILL